MRVSRNGNGVTMKIEKRCDNCLYGKLDTRAVLPVLCCKSIRIVKSKNKITYAFHSCDDKCRNWTSAEPTQEKE